jgi:signal recognition particle receptor subunit beta
MQVDFKARELTVKLVYYGPALSGKTTNLQAIHRLVNPKLSGRLMTLETRDDRTLFFDLLPLVLTSGPTAPQVRIKLFTVPGQVMHNATRRLVLSGADGIAFIADSQKSETKANQESFLNMQENLRENGMDPDKVPLVIQFNKRDLGDIRSDDELDRMAAKGKEPVTKAVAIRGTGVLETFLALMDQTWMHLEEHHGLKEKFGIEPQRFLADLRAKLRAAEAPTEAAP